MNPEHTESREWCSTQLEVMSSDNNNLNLSLEEVNEIFASQIENVKSNQNQGKRSRDSHCTDIDSLDVKKKVIEVNNFVVTMNPLNTKNKPE